MAMTLEWDEANGLVLFFMGVRAESGGKVR